MKTYLLGVTLSTSAYLMMSFGALAAGEPPAGYQIIAPAFFCDVQATDATMNSYGNIASASGVKLTCGGKSIDLTDGKIANGWLETKEFGKLWISRSGVYVTKEQNEKLQKSGK